MPPSTTVEPVRVPALQRASEVLQLLAATRAALKPADLLAGTGLSRSTLYATLEALAALRWIEKRADGYIVGVRLFELGSAYLRHDGLQQAFRDEAGVFIAAHNEVVQMAVLEGAEVVYVAREDADRPARLVSDIGMRLPAHSCALGKALLAQLSDAEVGALLPRTLPALTPRTVTRLPALLKALDEVRRRGVALDVEEVSAGLLCYAAYVGTTSLGRRVAVSTSVPSARMTARRERRILVAVVEMARRIAARIAR